MMDCKDQQLYHVPAGPLPPPSYSEATTTDPLTTDGFVSPMTMASSPVAFNVSVSPMAMTPINSRSTESFALSPLTETDLASRNHSTLEVAHPPRVDADCLAQAVTHDAPELALVEYAHNRGHTCSPSLKYCNTSASPWGPTRTHRLSVLSTPKRNKSEEEAVKHNAPTSGCATDDNSLWSSRSVYGKVVIRH
ncbi:hypothetical protein FCOIX_1869 [Fusarium coicis]|nr:hypothetical protein FCOIX_1869 [Fusarium coicis]